MISENQLEQRLTSQMIEILESFILEYELFPSNIISDIIEAYLPSEEFLKQDNKSDQVKFLNRLKTSFITMENDYTASEVHEGAIKHYKQFKTN